MSLDNGALSKRWQSAFTVQSVCSQRVWTASAKTRLVNPSCWISCSRWTIGWARSDSTTRRVRESRRSIAFVYGGVSEKFAIMHTDYRHVHPYFAEATLSAPNCRGSSPLSFKGQPYVRDPAVCVE